MRGRQVEKRPKLIDLNSCSIYKLSFVLTWNIIDTHLVMIYKCLKITNGMKRWPTSLSQVAQKYLTPLILQLCRDALR